jgi:shikimate kinase
MKKRRAVTAKNESSTDSTVDKLLSLSRNQRLLTLALQMPQVQSLFRKISSKKIYNCFFDHFAYWKLLGAAYHEQKQRNVILKTNAAVVIQCLIRRFLARVRVRNQRKYLESKLKQVKIRAVIRIQCMIRRKIARTRVFNMKIKKKKNSIEESVTTIQRVFRGYLGRGKVILLNRNKLIKQIRSWSNGVSSNILHIPGNFFSLFLRSYEVSYCYFYSFSSFLYI